MNEDNTQNLAARLAGGEEAAFAELYDRCADRLFRWLSLRIGSRDSAADVLQTTFLRAVKRRRRFRAVENPVSYLFQIARNEANRAMRNGRQAGRQSPPLEELFAVEGGHSRSDDEDAAVAALSRLDPDDRELVVLKIYAGLSFREIADVLDLPQGTVATRYRRALQSLRGWLAKQIQ